MPQYPSDKPSASHPPKPQRNFQKQSKPSVYQSGQSSGLKRFVKSGIQTDSLEVRYTPCPDTTSSSKKIVASSSKASTSCDPSDKGKGIALTPMSTQPRSHSKLTTGWSKVSPHSTSAPTETEEDISLLSSKMSNLRLKSKSPERNLKSKSSKFSDKRSCFACHEIGHVNSCCPNRARRSFRKSVSPPKPNRCEGSSSTSQGFKNSNVSMNHAPRTVSPRNSGSPVQKKTPYRSVSPHNGIGLLPTPTSGRFDSKPNYYNRFNSQVQNNNGLNSTRQFTPRPRQTSPVQRPVVSSSRNQTNVPTTGNGYWAEMTIVDEKGNPKSVKAWVLHDN
jgi:hypothetical protein